MHVEMVKKNHIFVLVFKFENVIEELPSFPVFLNVFVTLYLRIFYVGEENMAPPENTQLKKNRFYLLNLRITVYFAHRLQTRIK